MASIGAGSCSGRLSPHGLKQSAARPEPAAAAPAFAFVVEDPSPKVAAGGAPAPAMFFLEVVGRNLHVAKVPANAPRAMPGCLCVRRL